MPAIRIEIQGQSFDAPLPDAAVRIGSAEDADLRLQVSGLGSEQCVLEPLPGGRFKLRDSGSGYPTKVNGIEIKQVSLSDGDLIEIGDARITYVASGAPAAAPAPAVPAPAARPAQPARPAEPAPRAARPAQPAPEGADAAPRAQAERKSAAAAKPAAERSGDQPRRGERAAKKSRVPVLGIVAAVLVLGVIVFAVSGLGSGGQDAAERLYAEGQRLYDAQDYAGARALWRQLADDKTAGLLRARASEGLELIGDVQREMDSRLERIWSERLDMTPEALAGARRRFLESYGDSKAAAFDDLITRVRKAQAWWKKDHLAKTRAEADEHTRLSFFAKARAAWKRLARAAPAAVDVLTEVDESLKQLDADADAKAAEIVERVDAWNKAGRTFNSKALLQDMLPRFEGLAAHASLQKAWERTLVEHAKPVIIEPTQPGPDRPTRPDQPTPTQPTTEDARRALEKRVADLLAKAKARADVRDFQAAAELLRGELESFPPGDVRARLEGRARDHELAEDGLARLIADINANPDRYQRIKLTTRLSVAVIEADRETLSAKVSGGRSKHHWSRIGSSAFVQLVERMRPGKATGIPAAALLHAVGKQAPAERVLYMAGEDGCPTSDLFPLLARWRGESIPEGGYVVHKARYVTPQEREHLIREEKIAAALKRLDARDAAERKAAYEELLAIGEPARERFQSALSSRRAWLIDQLVRSKSFTGGKYKAKLLKLLAERRKHALALIYDAQAYPYPNPQKKNQKEVEARVDKVREVWERPFDLVAQWDKKLEERLAGVTEVDEILSRVDSGYTPDLQEIKDRINKAIDVPSSADPGKRPYSLKVLVYNTTLPTTATPMEKQNVRSVNDYRMMMGLLAVKIDEKLTRAARGHSRHMAQNGYFAHNVPGPYATPENRTPGSRAKQQGFGGGVGENIARGPSTGHGAFMAWFRSSGHHRNMLGRGWMVMGCGRANGSWWTQLFGGGSKSLKTPDKLPDPAPPFAPDKEGPDKPDRPDMPFEVPDEVPPGDPQPPADEPEDEGDGGADR
ncbi:MAG: CAP domain-containing protein [Planctomycetota bacterium]|nr:CAP domain-containing protein [Planctomycetota bacterium]